MAITSYPLMTIEISPSVSEQGDVQIFLDYSSYLK